MAQQGNSNGHSRYSFGRRERQRGSYKLAAANLSVPACGVRRALASVA